MYQLTDYDYDLPEELISHSPEERRDRSRLLALGRETGDLSHHRFADLADKLTASDILVVNNTEVVPGRLYGKKASGGKVEILILDYNGGRELMARTGVFESPCLIKASKRPKNGTTLYFDRGLTAEVLDFTGGVFKLRFHYDGDLDGLLAEVGYMPLPPYIKRDIEAPPCNDKETYQTVYASRKGAIAAPTAGLHFTDDLLDELRKKGVKVVEITLHVGYGTFLPVRVDDIREHRMHEELYTISESAAAQINRAKKEGGRVIAVGTTSVRTLEFASSGDGLVKPGTGSCGIFIYPGYRFKVVDGMVTNFHLPQSTLIMLVSAFAGRDNVFGAYREAVSERYRFFSYGDAMFIA